MMIQSVWKNLTGLQKAAEHLWCDFKWDTNSSPNTNKRGCQYLWQYSAILEMAEWGALRNIMEEHFFRDDYERVF